MSWINPKLDWRESDYYNCEDLNRVENNTIEVANYLRNLQYIIPIGPTVTNRDMSYIDLISSINRIENNINIIKDNFIVPPGWLQEKFWVLGVGYTYEDANRLESNLNILYRWAQIAKQNLIYCGDFSCNTEWEGGLY